MEGGNKLGLIEMTDRGRERVNLSWGWEASKGSRGGGVGKRYKGVQPFVSIQELLLLKLLPGLASRQWFRHRLRQNLPKPFRFAVDILFHSRPAI